MNCKAAFLLLTVILFATPAGAGSLPATKTDAEEQQASPAPKSEDEESVELDEFIAALAAETPPTMLYAPNWLALSRDIGFRFRPNSGIRLRPLAPNRMPSLSNLNTPLKPWSVSVSLAALPARRELTSAKFQEHRDIRDGVGVEAHTLFGKSAFSLVGRHLGLDDADLFVAAAKPGTYVLSLGWNATPHRYSSDARSLYGGIGTSRLTISDALRADLQSSTGSQDAANRIRSHFDIEAESVEIGVRRTKNGIDFTLMALEPFTIRAAFSNESRKGGRPSSASFGFSNFVELPWPVVDDTRDAGLTVEYMRPGGRVYTSGALRVSSFQQENASLLFDNPYRITDTSTGAVIATTAAGPGTGRLALEPSNTYREATLSSVITRLPMRSSVSAVVSAGFMRQDEPLLPFSTNTAARLTGPDGQLFAATDPNALPRTTAQAAMNTVNGQLRVTSQPARRVHVVAQYRFFQLENDEKPFVIPAFIRTDADARNPATPGGTFSSLAIAHNRHIAGAEGSLDLPANTRFSLGYTWEQTNRQFRETARMVDHRVKASLSTRSSWVDLQGSFEHSQRDIGEYAFGQSRAAQGNPLERPVLPLLRKFDEAARSRDEVQLNATRQLTDALTFSAMVLYGRDQFPESRFGIIEDRQRTYSMEAGYNVDERLSLFLSYTAEKRFSFMRARQWSNAAPSNPYTRETGPDSNSNWEARPRDDYRTASVGLEAALIPQRLQVNVAYVYSRSDGLVAFASPVGTAADDVNAFVPAPFTDRDDVEMHSFNPELEYRFSDRWSLSAGYQYEKYGIEDVNYRGFTFTPRNLNGGINAGLLMGGFLYPNYGVNLFYARLRARL